MNSRILPLVSLLFLLTASLYAQSREPYPNSATDRFIRLKTPMAPPPVNTMFTDPDFGSSMVRITDEHTSYTYPMGYIRTEGSGNENVFSADTKKFYVISEGGATLAFGFDPQTMRISSLPGAPPNSGLLVPLRPGTFSPTDPDLIYGTTNQSWLTISSYRFSTGVRSTVIDTTTCGTNPRLVPGPGVTSGADDVSVSRDDTRFSISEGGPQFGKDMFIVVFDRKLGCRWYNTQTGQIGGQWGAAGTASLPQRFLINHASLSKDGAYIKIAVDHAAGKYIWNVASTNVVFCSDAPPTHCGGYGGGGTSHFVNGAGYGDEMNFLIRPFADITKITPLVSPLPSPPQFGIQKHFSWTNANATDTNPICGSTLRYYSFGVIDRPWDGEIICVETDGLASTIWRFAHNRATADDEIFNTQPLGNTSPDGRFFIFTSDWDGQVGVDAHGAPRSDAWIVKLQ
ncbi:MAG TPA: hypothetical protein VJQ82_18670 [Terriglobales bacterium]|nr:hypothetical protein [Terriglobales bacterium]